MISCTSGTMLSSALTLLLATASLANPIHPRIPVPNGYIPNDKQTTPYPLAHPPLELPPVDPTRHPLGIPPSPWQHEVEGLAMKIDNYHEPSAKPDAFREFSVKLGEYIYEQWQKSTPETQRWKDGKMHYRWGGVTIEMVEAENPPAEMTYERLLDIGTFLVRWTEKEDSKVPSANLELFDTEIEGRDRPICKGTLKSGLFGSFDLSNGDYATIFPVGGETTNVGNTAATLSGEPGTITVSKAKSKAKSKSKAKVRRSPSLPLANSKANPAQPHDHKHKRQATQNTGEINTPQAPLDNLAIPSATSYSREAEALTIRLGGYVWATTATRETMTNFLSALNHHISTVATAIPTYAEKKRMALWPNNELKFKWGTETEDIVLHMTGGMRRGEPKLDVATVEDVAKTIEVWISHGGDSAQGGAVPSSGVEVWIGTYEKLVARGILGIAKKDVASDEWMQEFETQVLGAPLVAGEQEAGEETVGITTGTVNVARQLDLRAV